LVDSNRRTRHREPESQLFDAGQRTFGREYDGAVSGLKKWLPLEAIWRFS
jgi:hypothetical protein